MSSTDPVVLALRAALQAGNSVPLRIAVARRLAELGAHAEGLAEAEQALALEPANNEVLQLAQSLASASGDAVRAVAYKMALDAQQLHTQHAPVAAKMDVPVRPATSPAHQAAADKPMFRLVADEGKTIEAVKPGVTFADIGGLEEVKRRLNRSFLLPLKQPELYAQFGKSSRGGLLLYGPPGCGKTYIARALAGEIGARFLSIAISDVLDMYIGESERKLHELFENARRMAPVVVFFDEVDAIGRRRTQLKNSGTATLVNQFLTELDGVGDRNKDMFVLGATNHPWDIDPALRRPGRFDRMVFVPSPDAVAREHILSLKVKGRPVAPNLDLRSIAARTDGHSGADLEAIINVATDFAFERSIDASAVRPVDNELLALALKDVRPSTTPWLETARNYAMYANEGGVYDDLLAYLKARGMG